MSLIQKITVNNACYFIHIPEINFKLLCSAPEDVVKHLKKLSIIKPLSKDGVSFEDGPNAILLSDTSMQNGRLCNLSEFPVLHMLYIQGMIIPNHPNNSGKKPLLLGSSKQVTSNMEYIYLGNYGVTSKENMLDMGVCPEDADTYISMKKAFAFGKFKDSHELLDHVHIEEKTEKIEEDLYITRESHNVFTLTYKDVSTKIDLNLKKDEVYYPPYNLGYYKTKLEHFAIAHIGNGDGWNVDEPSMSSVLFDNGKIYLIDAGPNVSYLLDRLSISINEIAGVFITHVHDDHFCGLFSLMESDKKMTIYAIGIVRESIIAKLAIIINVPKNMVSNFVDFVDLKPDIWNSVYSLEVKPLVSPHPIETTIFYFRKMSEDGYKTYGHLADLASFDVLDKLSEPHKDDEDKKIFDFYQNAKKNYILTADLKKIDAGGGMIHGQVSDFEEDESKKIIIAHKSQKATFEEIGIASETFFGSVDVLDTSYIDYDINSVYKILNEYFSGHSNIHIDDIANNKIVNFNPGNIISKKDEKIESIYLTLRGNVSIIRDDTNVAAISSGSFLKRHTLFAKKNGDRYQYRLGFAEITNESLYKNTQIAKSFVSALKIPKHIFNKFIGYSLHGYQEVEDIYFQKFIYSSFLFGNAISSKIINNIAENMQLYTFFKDDILHNKLTSKSIFLIYSGDVLVKFCNNKPNILSDGDFFGADQSVFSFLNIENITVSSDKVIIFEIPVDILINSPIIYRKMLENHIKHKDYIYEFVAKSIPYEKDNITLPKNIETSHKIMMEKISIFEYMIERLEDKKLIENFMNNLLKYLKAYSDEVELVLIKNLKLKDVFKFVRKDIKKIIKLLSEDLDKLDKELIKYEDISKIHISIKKLLFVHKKNLQNKLQENSIEL